MLHVINTRDAIDLQSETHYRFHKQVPSGEYPQVHDFCELMLMTEGQMTYTADGKAYTLRSGDLVFTHAGIVHSKEASGNCRHINLAFPTQTLQEMLDYLKMPELAHTVMQGGPLPAAHMTPGETLLLQTSLQQLNCIPLSSPALVRMHLRHLLLQIFIDHFIPVLMDGGTRAYPRWFSQLLEWLNDPVHFTATLDDLAQISQNTKEHICRTFRRHLGTSPSAYVNALRLNYVANMLQHSDHPVLDIAFEAGFQSVSRFYDVFKRKFKVSPLQYRRQNSTWFVTGTQAPSPDGGR